MKKLVAFLVVFLFALEIFAQSHENGTLSFQFGYRYGIQNTTNRINSLPDLKEIAITNLTSIRAHYNLFSFLSVGLSSDFGNYTDDSTLALDKNFLFNLGLEIRGYVVNLDNMNVYAGLGYGLSSLKMSSVVVGTDQTLRFKSPNAEIYGGINWYVLKIVGLHAQLGYSKKDFELSKFSIDEVEQDLTNIYYDKGLNGFEFQAGISVKIL
jgi:hypothetical protein